MIRKGCLLVSLFVVLIISEGLGQEKLVKQEIAENIKMKVPVSFIPMSEKDMWQRVSSYRKSLALYTDMDRLIELGVNRAYSTWVDGDYEMLHEVYKSSILQLFDEVDFLKDEITQIKRNTFVVFEFTSQIKADEVTGRAPISKYTYLQYTIHDGETLVFSFNCPTHQMEKWQETAGQIMNSVIIK